MSTTTAEVHEEHTSQEEVERLAHPKPPARQRVGMIASYVGMALIVLYCIIPFYWMVVLVAAPANRRAEHRAHPEPSVVRELPRRLLGTEQLRPLTRQLHHRGWYHNDLDAPLRRILPLAAPGVFTTAITVFIDAWNEFLLALTFLQDASMQTATVAISKFTARPALIRRTGRSWQPAWS
jgi:ABC-type glycerol-3-phosphate transport system permease component